MKSRKKLQLSRTNIFRQLRFLLRTRITFSSLIEVSHSFFFPVFVPFIYIRVYLPQPLEASPIFCFLTCVKLTAPIFCFKLIGMI